MSDTPKKPILLRLEDFRASLARAVNSYDLPPFVMHPILLDVVRDVEAAMQRQYNRDLEDYRKACAEAAKKPLPGPTKEPGPRGDDPEVTADG